MTEIYDFLLLPHEVIKPNGDGWIPEIPLRLELVFDAGRDEAPEVTVQVNINGWKPLAWIRGNREVGVYTYLPEGFYVSPNSAIGLQSNIPKEETKSGG